MEEAIKSGEIQDFFNKYSIVLNEQQKEAVLMVDGKILLLAVPRKW